MNFPRGPSLPASLLALSLLLTGSMAVAADRPGIVDRGGPSVAILLGVAVIGLLIGRRI